MGKVYQFAEITENSIPNTDNFCEAKDIVLQLLSNLASTGEIYGGKIFGSVAIGTPTPRSDFDLLVVVERESAIPVLQKGFEEIHMETRVGIEPIVINKTFAERGLHSIDPLFLQHIQAIPNEGNTAGLDPIEIMRPYDLSVTKVHEQYLAQKLRRLQEGIFAYTDTDRYRVLQRAFEAPVNVGRRTLQTLSELGLPNTLADDGKAEVVREFKRIFEGNTLISDFDSLSEQDWQYNFVLREALQGKLGQNEYEHAMVSFIHECIPKAIRWTSDVSLFYAKLLEGNAHNQEGDKLAHRGKEAYL